MLNAVGFSECGPARSSNQDSILVDHDRGLFIVADGMGGLERGKEVSTAAIQLFVECLSEKVEVEDSTMLKCLINANSSLFEDSRQRDSRAGTTFTAVQVRPPVCDYVHIGDSRLYYFDSTGNRLHQKTTDHSLSTELERSGTSALVTRQFRHILTRSVGTGGLINPTGGSFRTFSGDALLLCSDGFWQLFSEDELANYLGRGADLSELANELKTISFSRNPQDNFSLVLIKT